VRTREELPDRSPIALGQARLTLKLQLVGMSILLILLSPVSGCYILGGPWTFSHQLVNQGLVGSLG
jgi:hypothetical protein